jgi:hypothetical protein
LGSSPFASRGSSRQAGVQWVDSEKWLLILNSRALKNKLEVMRLVQVVQNRFQKMNMKKIKTKNGVPKYVKIKNKIDFVPKALIFVLGE